MSINETAPMIKKYHITKTGRSWQAKLENSHRASVTGSTKIEVKNKIYKIAANYGNSEVYIYNSHGKLSSIRNFKPKK